MDTTVKSGSGGRWIVGALLALGALAAGCGDITSADSPDAGDVTGTGGSIDPGGGTGGHVAGVGGASGAGGSVVVAGTGGAAGDDPACAVWTNGYACARSNSSTVFKMRKGRTCVVCSDPAPSQTPCHPTLEDVCVASCDDIGCQ